MGWQIIQQPNKKYCIFSSVVDNVTHYNCTREEIIQLFIDQEALRIRNRISEIIDQLEAGEKPYYQFTKSFEEMINTIGDIHSKKEALEVENMLR